MFASLVIALLASLFINVLLARQAKESAEQARDERQINYSKTIEFQFKLEAFARKAELVTRFEGKLQKLMTDIETLYSNQIYFEKTLTEVMKGIVSDGSKDRPN